MAQKDTVNAHGGEAGRHKESHWLARQKIMKEMGLNKTFMEDANNQVGIDKIELEASTKSKE